MIIKHLICSRQQLNIFSALIYQSIKQSWNVGFIFSILRLKRTLAPKEVKLLIPGHVALQLRPSKDWIVPTHTGEGHLLYESSNSKTNLYQKHIDTLRNNV